MDSEREIASIHLVGGHSESHVEGLTFKNPAVWGLVLADLARTISKAVAAEHGVSEAKALSDILNIFDAEIRMPSTDIHMRTERPS